MKRLVLLFIPLLAFQLNLSAQNLVFDTETSNCAGAASEFEVSCENHIKNMAGFGDTMVWVRTLVSGPSAWDVAVCDENACYPPNIGTKWFIALNNETSLMKVVFRPNNTSGSGLVKVHVYAKSDSANSNNTAYYHFNTITSTSNYTAQAVKDIFIYPTPVREIMNVVFNANLKPNRIDVFNVLGQKVKTFPVQLDRSTGRVELQLADLDKGMYFVRVYQDGSSSVITRQFTKE